MQHESSRLQVALIWLAIVSTVLAVALACYIGVLALNSFATTPDIAGLACAADRFATSGELGTYQNWNLFEMCWNAHTYPALQYIHGYLLQALPLHITTLVHITPGIAYAFTILLLGYVSWAFTKRRDVTILAMLLAIPTPALLRSVLLTPQNLFGFALLAGIMATLAWQAGRHGKTYGYITTGVAAIITVILLGLLALTHDLSFSIAAVTVVLWFCVAWVRPWWLRALLLITGGALLAMELQFGFLPSFFGEKLQMFLSSNLDGVYKPAWDHPSIWGYVTTGLAAIGVFGAYRNAKLSYEKAQIRSLLLIVIVVAVAFGQAPLLGVGLLPNRFVPFAWLGLIPFAAIGLVQLRTALHLQHAIHTTHTRGTVPATWYRQLAWVVLAASVVGAQFAHGLRFVQDDINGWAFRYRPRAEFSAALQTLNALDANKRVIGVQIPTNQEILLGPLWYNGNVLYYPWYDLNHRDIMKFEVINPQSTLVPYFKNPQHRIYKQIRAQYALVTTPASPEAKATIASQGLDYIIMPKASQPYTKIWHAVEADLFPLVIETDTYAIFKLR